MDRKTATMDWKKALINFMKLIGEESDEWYPELWESYGITKEDAKIILDEYENYYD